jgi:hypothetical protein
MWNDGNFDYDARWHPALGIWSCHVADWRTESNGRHDLSALFGLDELVPGSGPDIVLGVCRDTPSAIIYNICVK